MSGRIPFYRPWRPELWQLARRSAWQGKFYLLDVQLGSSCNAHCPKCDSSCATAAEPAELDLLGVVSLAREISDSLKEVNWGVSEPLRPQGFVCGLGEPTAGENLKLLKDLVIMTKDFGFNWAFFTNGVYWDDDLQEMLEQDLISVQVQHHGNSLEQTMSEMGLNETWAAEQMENRSRMYDHALYDRVVSGKPGTNVCASIVPTRDNYHGIFWDWVKTLAAYNVFPLIAELEEAGDCTGEAYERQRVSNADLSLLKEQIWEDLGYDYKVPFCPATIGAIHVNNRNLVTVDTETGWSCGWPGMKSAGTTVLADIRDSSLEWISHQLCNYRKSVIDRLRGMVYDQPHMVFGGCGGNMRYLLQDYIASYDEFIAAGGGVISWFALPSKQKPRFGGAAFWP